MPPTRSAECGRTGAWSQSTTSPPPVAGLAPSWRHRMVGYSLASTTSVGSERYVHDKDLTNDSRRMMQTQSERTLAAGRPAPFFTSCPIIGATDRSNVSLYGALQDLLGARIDHALPVVAVHAIEREGHQRSTDRTNGLFGKRDEVRNAAHEREGLAIQVRDGHVGRAHRSLAPRSGRPVKHRSTGEMPAATDQRDALLQLEAFALPELDAAIRLPHPFGVVRMKMHRHISERSAPINKRRVEVRMRNGDGAQSAKSVNQRDRSVVDQGDAIPEDVPFRRTQE